DRDRVQVMESRPAVFSREHESRLLENLQVFGDRLPADLLLLAKLAQRLAVPPPQPIEDRPAMFVGQGLEYCVAPGQTHFTRPSGRVLRSTRTMQTTPTLRVPPK